MSVLNRAAYHLHNLASFDLDEQRATDDALAVVLALDDPTPRGYLDPPVCFEPCPDCGTLAPAWRRQDFPDFVELLCACGHESGAEMPEDVR